MIVGGKEPEDDPVSAWEEAEPTDGITRIRQAEGGWATELPANTEITRVASARDEVARIHAIEPTNGDFNGVIAVAVDAKAPWVDGYPGAEDVKCGEGGKAGVSGTGGRKAGVMDSHLATCATTECGPHHSKRVLANAVFTLGILRTLAQNEHSF